MNYQRWTEDEVRYLVAQYARATVREIAVALKRPARSVYQKATVLRAAGTLNPRSRAYQPYWTPAEAAWARAAMRDGWTLLAVAERLRRAPNAVKLKLRRSGVKRPVLGPTDGTLSLTAVAQALGVTEGDRKRIHHWIQRGWLIAGRRAVRGKRPYWAIYPADLIEFLRSHPEAYDGTLVPELVGGKPNPFRPHAHRGDRAAGYLTPKQYARATGSDERATAERCRCGSLPAVHLPGFSPRWWFIPKSALPPERRAA